MVQGMEVHGALRVMHLNEQLVDQGAQQGPDARGHQGHPPPTASRPAAGTDITASYSSDTAFMPTLTPTLWPDVSAVTDITF